MSEEGTVRENTMEKTNGSTTITMTTNGSFKDGKNPLTPEFTQGIKVPEKKEDDDEKAQTMSYFKLFKYATPTEKFLLYIGLLFALINGLATPTMFITYGEFTTLLVDRNTPNITLVSSTVVLPWFGGGRITDGTPEDNKEAIKEDAASFGIAMSLFAVFTMIMSIICVTSLNYSALMQTARLRRNFLKAVLRQDMSWYDCNNANSFPSRMIEDLDKVQEGIGEKIGLFTFLISGFLASVATAFLEGWKLTLVMLSCTPLLCASYVMISKVQTRLTTNELEAYGKAGSIAEEVFSSIKTVMAFSGQQKEIERYHKALEDSLKTGTKKGMLSGLGVALNWFVSYACYALAFWYGVSLILESRRLNNSEYTPAVLIIIFFGVLSGAINLGQSTYYMEAFSVARGAGYAVFSILKRTPKIDSLSTAGKTISDVKGQISFNNIFFQYPSRPEIKVLRGFNLEVKSGEVVALVGHSGCGKSTVVQLLQRLYDPSEGSVHLDGHDLKDLNVHWLRQQFGVVGQEPSLFSTTIYENIRYGLDSATKEDVERAAKLANAHDFIMKLPMGYETKVGKSQISGGQKQRIAIARALIRNPKILLLDEATSALDSANEKKVQEALDNASRGRTTLVVTHKMNTITKADRIIVLSEGKVVEEGTHEELLKLKGHYFRLVETQVNNEKSNFPIEENKPDEDVVKENYEFNNRNADREMSVEDENDDKTPPASFLKIFKYNKPELLHIFGGMIGSFVVGASVPILAVLFGELYGVLSDEDPNAVRDNTGYYSGMLLALALITALASFFQTYLLNYSGVKLTSRFRKLGFAAIIKQEAAWFDDEKNRTGILCARLSSSASDIQGATGSRVGFLAQAMSNIGIGLALSFIYSWKLTLVTLVATPVVFFGIYFQYKIMEGQSILEKSAIEEATKVSVEAITNIRTVASLGSELSFIDRYDKALLVTEKGLKMKSKLRGFVYGLGSSGVFFSYALALWYGGLLVAEGEIHYKDVLKISEALLFGMWLLGQSVALAPNFNQAKVSAANLFKILHRVPRQQDISVKEKENWTAEGKVTFSNVEFTYPTRPEVKVLQGLDLNIEKGLSIALVGPSGCGKSTVIQLLQRLYDPSGGKICLDDTDITSLKLSTLRRQMSIVSQEPVLFDRSIEENIAYGDNSRTVTQREIIEAAKSANIHTFIMSLPLGYETKVGSGGTQLSGGQKQRIAIARALIRNPKILLLDEATSALDAQSEWIVQSALDEASTGRTTITVGHRMAAIKNAHVIYCLDKGRIRQVGIYQDFLSGTGTQSESL